MYDVKKNHKILELKGPLHYLKHSYGQLFFFNSVSFLQPNHHHHHWPENSSKLCVQTRWNFRRERMETVNRTPGWPTPIFLSLPGRHARVGAGWTRDRSSMKSPFYSFLIPCHFCWLSKATGNTLIISCVLLWQPHIYTFQVFWSLTFLSLLLH